MSHAKVVVVGCLASLALVLAACSSSPTKGDQSQGSTNSGSTGSNSGGEAQIDIVKSCEADYKVLEVALAAYDAQVGMYPTPPAPWSMSTYISNFSPLTSGSNGGPYLHNALDPQDYVIEYDGQGNVWIEPAGTYDASFSPAHVASDKVCESILH